MANGDDSRAQVSALADVRREWVEAVARKNTARLRELVTDDYEAWSHAAAPLQGPDAVVAAMDVALRQYRIAQSFHPVEAVIVGDWAFERGIEKVRLTPHAGGAEHLIERRAFLVYRRGADGRWRFARGITCGVPGAPAIAAHNGEAIVERERCAAIADQRARLWESTGAKYSRGDYPPEALVEARERRNEALVIADMIRTEGTGRP